MSELYSKNTYEILRENNAYFDRKLTDILDRAIKLTYDRDIFNVYNEVSGKTRYRVAHYDSMVNTVLVKYFNVRDNDIFSINLTTSYYSFGTRYVPKEAFMTSDEYKRAVAAGGNPVWETEFLASESAYENLFSCNMLLNLFYYTDGASGIKYVLSKNKERPVLTVNLKDSIFSDILSNSTPIPGSLFYVIGPNHQVVTTNDKEYLHTVSDYRWIDQIRQERNGSQKLVIQNMAMNLSYVTSDVTGWTVVVMIPQDKLMADVKSSMSKTMIVLFAALLFTASMLAVMLSLKIAKPMKNLHQAIEKTGEGSFGYKIPETGPLEFKLLTNRFNRMGEEIAHLIRENFEVKIHQKEAQIQLLNLQLNPHFLYNTLNLINCIAIEGGQAEISRLLVALSNILHYTADIKEMGDLQEEMKWLEDYIFIMSCRYEGKLTYIRNIDPAIYAYPVPRLFLQPFVENSFIHGFENLEQDYILTISAWIEGNTRFYSVEDNGTGISPEKLAKLYHPNNAEGIGIRNVDSRIKLIYGDGYGAEITSVQGEGTKVVVLMPTGGIKPINIAPIM